MTTLRAASFYFVWFMFYNVRTIVALSEATYLGCFRDTWARVLPNHKLTHPDMTVEKCIAHCRSYGTQRYAGLQHSSECYCGGPTDNYAKHGKVAARECRILCEGNSRQRCGGTWRISVYDLDAKYLGCYEDSPLRALPNHELTHTGMTVDMCFAHCRSFGNQKYAGLQNTTECFCGGPDDNYGKHGVAAEKDCKTKCKSKRSGTKCGEAWRISVYDLDATTLIDTRIVGGSSYNEGRVDVLYNGIWGTICDDAWTAEDATVICRQLGLPYGDCEAPGNARFGSGTGVIWLDDVSCTGYETNLAYCGHKGFGNNDCNHNEDAGVICADYQKPIIYDTPSNITHNADTGLPTTVVTWVPPTALDNTGLVTLTSSHVPGSTFTIGSTIVTYTAVDNSSNIAYDTFTITVEDNEKPIITDMPSDITQSTDAGSPTVVMTWSEPTATDNSGSVTLTSDPMQGSAFPIGNTVVTYRAIDDYSNVATDRFTITVEDNEKPTIPGMHPDITQNTDPGLATAVVMWRTPIPHDNSGSVRLTSSHRVGSVFPLGNTVVTYTMVDDSSNMATETFTITVVDNENPRIYDMPSDIIQNADDSLATTVVTWSSPIASDNTGSVTLTCSHSSGSAFTIGNTLVTYTAVDNSSNTATRTFTITVSDNENPKISDMPSDITQSTDAGLPTAIVTWVPPIATDNSGSVTLTSSPMQGSAFPIGDTIVTYKAIDGSSNVATDTFIITVEDNENPTISDKPMDITQSTDAGLATAVVTWSEPTPNDNSGSVRQTSSHRIGSTFPIGRTVVKYKVVDDSSNINTYKFTITVEDNENPAISDTPSDITQSTDAGSATAIVTWSAPKTYDNAGAVTLISNPTPGSAFKIGHTVVTYTAIDNFSNVATDTFVIIVEDNENPTISDMPMDITQNTDAGLPIAVVTWSTPASNDNSGLVTMTSSHSPGSAFTIGHTEVTYTAVDDSSNTATETFSITVEDNENPTISDMPTDITQNTDAGLPTAVVMWSAPTAGDNSGAVTQTSSHDIGSAFSIGNTVVTYTAIDSSSNVFTGALTITVEDGEKPTISDIPSDITQSTDAGLPTASVTWQIPTANDNSGSVTLTSSHSSGFSFPVGSTVVKYTAVDQSSNIATGTFTVTVEDNENPTLSDTPSDIIQNTDAGSPTAIVTWSEPRARDNHGSVTVTSTHNSGTAFAIGSTIVTYTAVDNSANIAIDTFTITVEDNETPTISDVPSNFTQTTDAGSATADVTWLVPNVIDNSGFVTLTSSHISGSAFLIGNTIVSYTATDESSNIATVTFTITVEDKENPVIENNPADIIQYSDVGSSTAIVSWSEPRASDNSGIYTLLSSHSPCSVFTIGITTVTYAAVDASSNVASTTFTVTMEDNESPMLVCPVVMEQFALTDQLKVEVTWPDPEYTDNCGKEGGRFSNYQRPATLPIGIHEVSYHAWDPSGNAATCSFLVTVTAACPANSIILKSEFVSWPQTPAKNQTVQSDERCDVGSERRGRGVAVRECVRNAEHGAIWSNAKYRGCGGYEDPDLGDLSETTVVVSNVESVAKALQNETRGLGKLSPKDLEDVAETFRNIVNVETGNPEVTKSVVKIVNNLVASTMDNTVSYSGHDENLSPHFLNILMALDKQVRRSTSLRKSLDPVVEPNIVLKTTALPPNQKYNEGLSFAVLKSKSDNRFHEDDVGPHDSNDIPQASRTSILLPASLSNTSSNDTVGVSFIVHNSDTLFPINSTNEIVGGDIISVILVGVPSITDLADPVVLEFTVSGNNPKCVFWDFQIQAWSPDGCQLVTRLKNKVICNCNHLSKFAVLVS